MDNGDEEQDRQETKEEALELVRVVDRTDFVSPTDYNREKEFVVRNNTNEPKNYIFLPLGQFRLNLEVFDEDDTKLNYFPNDEVEALLNDVKETDEDEYSQIEERFGDLKYTLFVQLPPERPIGPDELRSIRITFGQSEQPQYHRPWEQPQITGWITHWKQKFFRIPSFIARATRRPDRQHSELFVVEGPSEYVTVVDKSCEHADRNQFYENGYGDDTRVLSTHLPPAESDEYTWELNYNLVPNNTGLLRLLAGYWGIAMGIAVLIFVVQTALHFGCIDPEALTVAGFVPETASRSISTGVTSITVGVMYALRTEWAERYRILCVAPIVLHGISWFLWAIIGTNGG
ncbi:hypothetical protein [Halorussus litoreus]|uniref:hypothetical protein n=1 Tax=Halorussus litoreus TaxID=1710536 RepID=UPI000E2419C7|nr:hypothetical protein [Halorussus litoreus]